MSGTRVYIPIDIRTLSNTVNVGQNLNLSTLNSGIVSQLITDCVDGTSGSSYDVSNYDISLSQTGYNTVVPLGVVMNNLRTAVVEGATSNAMSNAAKLIFGSNNALDPAVVNTLNFLKPTLDISEFRLLPNTTGLTDLTNTVTLASANNIFYSLFESGTVTNRRFSGSLGDSLKISFTLDPSTRIRYHFSTDTAVSDETLVTLPDNLKGPLNGYYGTDTSGIGTVESLLTRTDLPANKVSYVDNSSGLSINGNDLTVDVALLGVADPNGLKADLFSSSVEHYTDPGNPYSNTGDGSILESVYGSTNVAALTSESVGTVGKSIRLTGNTSEYLISGEIGPVQSITMFCKFPSDGIVRDYLIDLSSTGNGVTISGQSVTGVWSDCSMYINGGIGSSLDISSVYVPMKVGDEWRQITLVANSGITDHIKLFNSFTGNQGSDVEFGIVKLYNRALSESDNIRIFEQYNSIYDIPQQDILRENLICYIDPMNPQSYPGTGTTITPLVNPQSVSVSVSGGTYNTSELSIQVAEENGYVLIGELTGIRTISVWYKSLTSTTPNYFIDLRTDGVDTLSGWIQSEAPNQIGDVFNTVWGFNGISQESAIDQATIIDASDNWKHVVLTTTSSITRNIRLFGSVGGGDGMNAHFGPIKVFDRVLTSDEMEDLYNEFADRYSAPIIRPSYVDLSEEVVYHVDPANPLSVDTANSALINLGYSYATTTISNYSPGVNDNTIRLTGISGSVEVSELRNLRTVSFICGFPSGGSNTNYLLDARTGATGGEIIISSGTLGSLWSGCTMYVNGGLASTLTSTTLSALTQANDVYNHITLIANSDFSDNITFFNSNAGSLGTDVEFGIIQMRNDTITESGNISFFSGYYPLYNIPQRDSVTDGLIYYFDPINTNSYSGSGSSITPLVDTGTAGNSTLFGSYTFNTSEYGINFAEEGSYIDLPSLTNIRSICFWYKPLLSNPASYLMDFRDGEGQNYWIWDNAVDFVGPGFRNTWALNGVIQPSALDTSTERDLLLYSPGNADWRHAVITTDVAITKPGTFFARFNNATEGMNARLGPVKIFNKLLTSDEVASLYNEFAPRYGKALI